MCSLHSISLCRLKRLAAAAVAEAAEELAAMGLAAGRTLRAQLAVLAAPTRHRRSHRTVRLPLQRTRIAAQAKGQPVTCAAAAVAPVNSAAAAVANFAAVAPNFVAVVEGFGVVADLVAVAVDSVAVAADSLAPAVDAGDEDKMERRRCPRPAAARRRTRARSTRSSHRCPQLNLEVASGRSLTNS
jgi:hypothetical protein